MTKLTMILGAAMLLFSVSSVSMAKECEKDSTDPKLCKNTNVDCTNSDGKAGKCEQIAKGCNCKLSGNSDLAVILLTGFAGVYFIRRRQIATATAKRLG